MDLRNANVEDLIRAGTKRLLERARNSRNLTLTDVIDRVAATTEKYLLRDCPNSTTEVINDFIDRLNADDLCLVVACELNEEDAWRDLVNSYSPRILKSARRLTNCEDAAEELLCLMWADLFDLKQSKTGEAKRKLSYYSGLGSLGGWLSIVIRQIFVNQHRKNLHFAQPEQERHFDCEGVVELHYDSWRGNPELGLIKKESNKHLAKALLKALGSLQSKDRLLLKLYYFEGLRMDEVGKILKVHQSTISRRLAQVHSQLAWRVRVILKEDYGWTSHEISGHPGKIRIDADLTALSDEIITAEALWRSVSNEFCVVNL